MKIGSLVRIQHFQNRFNGKLGIVMAFDSEVGFVTIYSVRVPSFDFEVALYEEQCRVIA